MKIQSACEIEIEDVHPAFSDVGSPTVTITVVLPPAIAGLMGGPKIQPSQYAVGQVCEIYQYSDKPASGLVQIVKISRNGDHWEYDVAAVADLKDWNNNGTVVLPAGGAMHLGSDACLKPSKEAVG